MTKMKSQYQQGAFLKGHQVSSKYFVDITSCEYYLACEYLAGKTISKNILKEKEEEYINNKDYLKSEYLQEWSALYKGMGFPVSASGVSNRSRMYTHLELFQDIRLNNQLEMNALVKYKDTRFASKVMKDIQDQALVTYLLIHSIDNDNPQEWYENFVIGMIRKITNKEYLRKLQSVTDGSSSRVNKHAIERLKLLEESLSIPFIMED